METRTYSKSQKTLSQIYRYRDENGFLDLDKAGIKWDERATELVCSEERFSNWVDFGDKHALIKGNALLPDGSNTFALYGELVYEDICRNLGIPSAHYDLVKFTKDGETIYGVLSEDILQKDEERTFKNASDPEEISALRSISDLMISEEFDGYYDDVIDYDEFMNELKDNLSVLDRDAEAIEKALSDLKKRIMLDMCCVASDNHLGNYSFIMREKDVDDKDRRYRLAGLAPNYDRENIFMLDTDKIALSEALDNLKMFNSLVHSTSPRIASRECDKHYRENEPWKGIFERLLREDECIEMYSRIKNINLERILDNLEMRIKSPLPYDARDSIEISFECRMHSIEKEFGEKIKERIKSIKRGRGNEKVHSI